MNAIKRSPLNKIRYLDGTRLRNAILAGVSHLEQYREYLDKINVFPVPDGDTGTNMFLTMQHVSHALLAPPNKSIAVVSSQVAEGALMGAQGNSGAILAQFFHGFAQGTTGKWQLTTRAFANAVQTAQKASHAALANPKDGTILSVITDWANYVHKTAQKTEDFGVLLKKSLQQARESLAETPKKLEVLKKAGVVDAGAQGFVHLLEGIVNFIDKGKIKQIVNRVSSLKATKPVQLKEIISDNTFRYCTECMVNGEAIDHLQVKNRLMDLGDSLIVAGGAKRIRVHIHTNSPASVFEILASHGEVSAQKIDDMIEQQQKAFPTPGATGAAIVAGVTGAAVERVGIVTDSSCDLPHHIITKHHIHVIPLKLIFGSQTFLDKVQISPGEFYDKLALDVESPKTSQPAAEEIRQMYTPLIPKYDRILSIHLPRALSGTFQAIEQAARKFEKDKITCIDGKSISCALGLVVLEAAEAIQEGLPLEKVIHRIHDAIENLHIFIILPSLKYLVKGGRLSKPKGIIGKILHLNPVISFDREGRVILTAKAFGEKNALAKSLKMAAKQARQYKKIKLMVAHANALAKAETLAVQLAGLFNINNEIPIVEAAPVLGVHAGPGTVGFAFIGYN